MFSRLLSCGLLLVLLIGLVAPASAGVRAAPSPFGDGSIVSNGATARPIVFESDARHSASLPAVSEPVTLTLLHNNDGESSLLPIDYAVPPGTGYPNTETVTLGVGSVAAFKTLTDLNIAEARGVGNAVLNVYAGDAFLASSILACSLPPNPPDTPIYDAVAQRQIDYTAHIIGNHEFDYSPDFLERFIRGFEVGGQLTQPFLSANLDFSAEPGFADLLDDDGLILPPISDGKVIGRSAIITDTETNQAFGIVGATTPQLPTISSPRNVTVTATITETAQVVQAEIDRLYDDYGVNKIIFVSHLQDVDNDRELVQMLRRVDIAVAGGGDELLVNSSVPTMTQLLPGEMAPIAGEYPLEEQDADGRTVYIVTTAGNYKYLGRLDVEFDAEGEVSRVITDTSYPRRVIPESDVATDLGLTDAVPMDPGIVADVNQPLEACLAALDEPIVRSEVLLDVSRNTARSRESNAGNLVTDGFIYAYDQYAAENGLPPRGSDNPVVAVQNGGGIRQNAGDILPTSGVVPDTITRRNTLDVLAFFNTMTVVTDVTPSDVKAIFERSADTLPGEGGQFLQISGLRVVYNLRQPQGQRVVSVTLEDGTPIVQNGAVVDGAPSISIITNTFTANGGDDYPTFANNPNKTQLFDSNGVAVTYEQAWVEYLLSLPPEEGFPTIQGDDPRYQPGGEGRIIILDNFRFFPIVSVDS